MAVSLLIVQSKFILLLLLLSQVNRHDMALA